MTRMRTTAAALLVALGALGACTANGTEDGADRATPPEEEGGTTLADAGAPEDAGGPSTFDPDAEAPLACGEAGFCETRLPKSELGLPLSLQSVWVVASNDVWSVTAEGYVLHHDGTSWTTAHRIHGALSTVWATATEVWAGGDLGFLLHRNAAGEWSRVETGYTSRIRAIAGMSEQDVWFANDDGRVDHFDGTTLAPHSLSFAGLELRITTLVAKPGLGAYAAGYIDGLPGAPERALYRSPCLVELTPAGVTLLNTNLLARTGFVPVVLQVTDAPVDDERFFLFGFDYTLKNKNNPAGGYNLAASYAAIGPTGPVKLAPLALSDGSRVGRTELAADPVPTYPVWAHRWDDVRLPYSQPYVLIEDLRWNGAAITFASLAMGASFVPRALLAVHGNATDTWMVGEGVALKGASQ